MIADPYTDAPSNDPSETERRYPEGAGEYEATGDRGQSEMTSLDALKLLLKEVGELKEYFSYYITAKTDSIKLTLRNSALWFVLLLLGFVTLGGLLVIASWYALSGLAGGFGVLAGERWWVGRLLAGVLCLAGLGFGIRHGVAKTMKTSRERTIRKYEARQTQQRENFGRDVSHGASPSASDDK